MSNSAANPLKYDPKRFEVSKLTLLADAFMTQFIKIGGIGIILAVFGIFIFIFSEVFPLFQSAKVEPLTTLETEITDITYLGSDDQTVLPFVADTSGNLHFLNLDVTHDESGHPIEVAMSERGITTLRPEIPDSVSITSQTYKRRKQQMIYGLSDGSGIIADINYQPEFAADGTRTMTVSLDASRTFDFGDRDRAVIQVDYFSTDTLGLAVGILEKDGERSVEVAQFRRKRNLFGTAEWNRSREFSLTDQIEGMPSRALINGQGNAILLATEQGQVYYFLILDGRELSLRQVFTPFADSDAATIGSFDWILGSESLVLTSSTGQNRIYSPSVNPETEQREYYRTKNFPALDGPADTYAISLLNRAFLIGNGNALSLRYGTTESIRWEAELDYTPVAVALNPRYDVILTAENDGTLHLYHLDDPHPEASWDAFFSKVWYEGQAEPAHIYQSSAAEAHSEPKFSMVNLIWGSLKGTIFAMVFSVPIALLAAIYTSQFLKPEYKKIVKPTMEIMASLPSVVLGFLGALWLAPRIENDVPSLIILLILLPVFALLFGFAWSRLPQRLRLIVPPGYEFLVFIPLLMLVGYVGWSFGPFLEQLVFKTVDPDSGKTIADFRLWWQNEIGAPFDQRNSMIVGFMMGFAVIPIIFTITEDSMSNVPYFLTSASLALGASRWQTAWKVVLPTASAGIFSALMIGLGRAVGETMIVVMCSGNTPVLDLNPFTGMRTLSANIAVELPEAPRGETHYRILYLGALILFLLTFVVNSLAEIARNHLREKYKTVS